MTRMVSCRVIDSVPCNGNKDQLMPISAVGDGRSLKSTVLSPARHSIELFDRTYPCRRETGVVSYKNDRQIPLGLVVDLLA